jgi:PAS domain S-box-containing protein
METVPGNPSGSLARRAGAALRMPWVAPAVLLAVVVVVGVVAFVYVSNVNDDVDRKAEAARVLSQMQTSTARLGNLAALGSEPSLILQAATDAFTLQVTLGQQLRRWDRVWDKPTPPAVAELRRAQAELTRRLRQALRGNVRAGRATAQELAQGNRLYHRIDDLHARVAADAADANNAGDTKTAVVTGVAIGFVVVMLALVQLARVRLRRMRRDTAMREALHAATRESEERYRYVTNLVPDQIFTLGADGRFDYMNERTATFIGGRLEDGATRWLDLHHPDDTLHVQSTWSSAIHAGEPVEVESRMLGADGEYHWILTRAIPQVDPDGHTVRWFCSGTDITGRQRQEQALREARQRLAEAQAIAHVGSWEWDIREDQMRWSDELHRLLGVPADMRLVYESFLDLVHPDDRERVDTMIREAVSEGGSFEFETCVIRDDGEERNVFCRGHVLTGDESEPTRIVGLVLDITDRVRAESERDRLEAELHQAQQPGASTA